MADQFTTDPIAFFTGVEADRAVELLRRYEGYTGAWFDRVAAISPPGTITPADIAALTLLDVSVPRDAARKITNPNGLESVGGNLYKETSSAGAPQLGSPGENGFGELNQGSLELSNVKVVEEMVNLILAQRAYEVKFGRG